MKPFPPIKALEDIFGFCKAVESLRRDDVSEIANLNTRLVQGRLRTDRIAPTSHSDVIGGDMEADIVRTAAYEYIVVNDAGTLKWARQALDVGW